MTTRATPLFHESDGIPVEFAAYHPDEAGDGFTLSEGSDAHEILGVLADQPGTGYTPEEISEATDTTLERVRTILGSLEASALVRHQEPYGTIGLDDRLTVYEGMVEGLDAMEDRHGDDSERAEAHPVRGGEGQDWTGREEMAVDPRRADE